MILVCNLLTVISLCTVLLNAHHIYFFIGAASISLHLFPDHSGGGPSPTVTQPHLLHLAGSLMQNEALTLYQSVKALLSITPILDPFTH